MLIVMDRRASVRDVANATSHVERTGGLAHIARGPRVTAGDATCRGRSVRSDEFAEAGGRGGREIVVNASRRLRGAPVCRTAARAFAAWRCALWWRDGYRGGVRRAT